MRRRLPASLAAVTALLAAILLAAPPAQAATNSSLTSGQRADLAGIARDTWRFFEQDVDPTTHLPLDNLGPGTTRGTYTSSANIGVYLWAVVAARDLGLDLAGPRTTLASATLDEVRHLPGGHGFLYQWYDTTTGQVIQDPGRLDCASVGRRRNDNCYFLSAVDNGWYASGLIVVRQALPELRGAGLVRCSATMDFSIFYDDRAQTGCNVNPAIDNQPTGRCTAATTSTRARRATTTAPSTAIPRIAMYVGMGLHQMPGDVWWRTWRTLPPKQCDTDPDFSWQGQWPVGGYWTTIRDPQSGKTFPVWEGHYTYPGTSLTSSPRWAGGMFEALMAERGRAGDDVGPAELRAGRRAGAGADQRTPPSSCTTRSGGSRRRAPPTTPAATAIYGVEGPTFPPGQQLAQCADCATETTVTPHASFLALDVAPAGGVRQHRQPLRRLYPDIYTSDGGFYDAVNPTTGSVGHRRLVLDQSMIMAALDNALERPPDAALVRRRPGGVRRPRVPGDRGDVALSTLSPIR